MKYKELKTIATNHCYDFYELDSAFRVERYFDGKMNFIDIDKKRVNSIRFSVDFSFNSDVEMFEACIEMFEACLELAKTPLEERVEEKKYLLKHRFLETRGINYLNVADRYFLGDKNDENDYKTHFTIQEIEEIKKKYNTSLDDFEIIEVEE